MIVTLAGHVDHGKTSLVERWTGVDTDRLAEERRRGLTIDLGFAYLHDGARTVGFVDVPGHHRFIHNMVAGVAAVQHALLVVAADDGPMPQSLEHLQILRLLGLERGVVALTKCDRVDDGRRRAAGDEIARLLAGTFLAAAPVVETSAATGEGIDELRSLLLERTTGLPAPNHRHPFRLAVDRAFTLKGAGLVVTGTVHGGSVAVEDEIFVCPGGRRARVRELRVQGRAAARAAPGDRAALNLVGLDGAAPQRGDWIRGRADAGHRAVVIELEVLDDFPRPVRHWTPVHVYHATSHAGAHLALLDGTRATPGSRVRAELVLDTPLLAKRGDRLVVRDHGLERTLGGGEVIDNRPWSGRRRSRHRLDALTAAAAATPAESLDAALALGPVDLAAFRDLWDLLDGDLQALVEDRPAILRQNRLVSAAAWQRWGNALVAETQRRHAEAPTLQGLRENEFESPVPLEYRVLLLGELAAAGRLEQRAGRYRPAGHRAVLDPAEAALLDQLRPHLDQLQPPSLGDLGRTLRLPLPELQRQTGALVSKGELVRINDKRLYLPHHVDRLAEVARALTAHGPFTARAYRDAAGIGRNVAIDMLEYFDARGFTRRQGDTRVVVGEAP